MKLTSIIVKALRNLEIPETHVREIRALFVAQSVAYQVPLSTEKDVSLILEEQLPTYTACLNAINEYLPVDTSLATEYFERLVKGRMELLHGVGDTALLKALLKSDTQSGVLSRTNAELVETLCSLPAFGKFQELVVASFDESASPEVSSE